MLYYSLTFMCFRTYGIHTIHFIQNTLYVTHCILYIFIISALNTQYKFDYVHYAMYALNVTQHMYIILQL